jgi:hypothetical protein
LYIPTNKVIGVYDKVCVSNVEMKRPGGFRSAPVHHGAYAITGGTKSLGADTLNCRRVGPTNSRPHAPQKPLLATLKIDVRQGIARMRRHVAPARLLC